MLSKSKFQTQRFASKLAAKYQVSSIKNQATVIALSGNLGSGKTAFVQGFCKALGVKHSVTSPTFIIFRKHPIPKSEQSIYHFDLYRIKNSRELSILGFKRIIKDPNHIVLIEWPELVKKLLPKNTIWINFEHLKKQNQRKIILSLPKGKV